MNSPRSPIPSLTRRSLLRIGGVSLAGFELLPFAPPLNAAAKQKVNPRGAAEYCIFVFLQGGASHVDSFDLKEGKWTPPDFDVRTIHPDLKMPTGLFPKLSQCTDKFAIVRSLEAWETEHGRATYYLHVAHQVSPARVREIPSLGAVIAYEFQGKRKPSDFLPPFVSMNYGPDQIKEGMLDSKYAPLNFDTKGGDLSFVVPAEERTRFDRRVGYLKALGELKPSAIASDSHPIAALDAFRSDALTMMNSAQIPNILSIGDEDKKRYGDTEFGNACILARNILKAESGTRFIAINHGGWDFHVKIYEKSQKANHYTKSRDLDGGLAVLLSDLEQTKDKDGRSLLDKTLVVVMGEFGRTPGELSPGLGRDHHRYAMSGLFAGGGVKGGKVLGVTDAEGGRVVKADWSKKRSMYPEDVAATIYSALGIDWTKEIKTTPSGRVFEYLEFQSGTSFLDVGEISELFV
jgi:hypothetical protein